MLSKTLNKSFENKRKAFSKFIRKLSMKKQSKKSDNLVEIEKLCKLQKEQIENLKRRLRNTEFKNRQLNKNFYNLMAPNNRHSASL